MANAAPLPAGVDDECKDHALDWVVWSADDVADYVDSLLGSGIGASFRLHNVDGPMLLGLTETELRDPLGLADPLHRAKLLGHVRAFRAARARLARRAAGRKEAGKAPGAADPRPQQAARRGPPPAQQFAPAPRQPQHVTSRSQQLPQRQQPQAVLEQAPAQHWQLSRSQSIASTLSDGCSVSGAGSRFSKRLGSSKVSGAACGSSFGLDSPSTSLRGTFGTSPKYARGLSEETPGPCSYNVAEAETSCAKAASSAKATIGMSPRWSAELPADSGGPGPCTYSVGSPSEGGSVSKRQPPSATFGNSPRETSRIDCESPTPGPSSYQTRSLALKPASPRAVIGTSPRNTSEYIVAPGTTATHFSVGDGVSSPRVKGGVIGSVGLSPRTTEPEKPMPGPCHYNISVAFRERCGPRATIGNAPRDTSEHFVKSSGPPRFACAGSPSRAKGGVIAAAARWRDASSGGGSPRSPGPMTYQPKPAALSNFR